MDHFLLTTENEQLDIYLYATTGTVPVLYQQVLPVQYHRMIVASASSSGNADIPTASNFKQLKTAMQGQNANVTVSHQVLLSLTAEEIEPRCLTAEEIEPRCG